MRLLQLAFAVVTWDGAVSDMTTAHTDDPLAAAAAVGAFCHHTPFHQLVKIHGGPTSAATTLLNLGYQYWTSRGFAIADVNYGEGSMHVGCVQDMLFAGAACGCGGAQVSSYLAGLRMQV
jgi:hypothetical protein